MGTGRRFPFHETDHLKADVLAGFSPFTECTAPPSKSGVFSPERPHGRTPCPVLRPAASDQPLVSGCWSCRLRLREALAPSCGAHRCSILLFGRMTAHHGGTCCLSITRQWAPGCAHFLSVVSSAALHICVQVFACVFIFLGLIPGSGIAGSGVLLYDLLNVRKRGAPDFILVDGE